MASASSGYQNKEKAIWDPDRNPDDFGEYDVRLHGTPTKRLKPEDGGHHGQRREGPR